MPTVMDPTTVASPLVLACMISYLLYGLSVVQFILYLVQYPNDRFCIKMLVWLVFTLETVTTVVVGTIGWTTFGKGFGDLASLNYLHSGWVLYPFISGIIASIVQNFLSWRIYILASKIWLSAIISIISVVGCAFSFYFGARVIQLGLYYDSPRAVGEYIDVWITCSAVCDVLGTGAMVTILAKSRSKTLTKSTNTLLWNILKFTAETGLITTIWAILHISLWLTMPQTSFHYIFYFSLSRLYSNWLFMTLNSRVFLAHSGQAISFGQNPLWSDLQASRPQGGPTDVDPPGPRVYITRTMEVVEDHIPNKVYHTWIDSSSV